MFTKVNKSQGTTKFQTVTKNRFSSLVTASVVSASTFTPRASKTITPNESEIISINRCGTYKTRNNINIL